jgi:hypothetical protein
MSEQDPELEAFSKFIVAIEPWLGEVVLVGGWAHRFVDSERVLGVEAGYGRPPRLRPGL